MSPTPARRAAYWLNVGAAAAGLKTACAVIGYPRSGTSWLCRLLAEVLGFPVVTSEASFSRVLGPGILHSHRFICRGRLRRRSVYIVRDGRDVMVSYYFFMMRRAKDRRGLADYVRRRRPGILDPRDIRANLPLFIEYTAQQSRPSVGYREHVLRALAHGLPVVRYEDLRSRTAETLGKILETLGFSNAEVSRIEAAAARHTFASSAGRPAGEEDRHSSFRKGVAGDWKEHFTEESLKLFDRYAGDVLERFGYERSPGRAGSCGG